MHAFLQIVASNSVVFAGLAVGVAMLGRIWKNPVGLHFLWVLALLKLVTPPLVTVPLTLPMIERPTASEGAGHGLLEDRSIFRRDAAFRDPLRPPPSAFPLPPSAPPVSDGTRTPRS
jgi:hypothetical protein